MDAIDVIDKREPIRKTDVDLSAALRRMDLNLLIPLNALLAERHVSRAAESIGVGQPAMSAALARLRRLFDDPLLVRSGRTMELTPLARALVEPVHTALSSVEHVLTTQPDFDPARDTRAFTVVASDYVTLILLRPLLERLYAEAPHVTVDVVPVSGTTETELDHAQVDLVVMPSELTTSDMRRFPSRLLFRDRYVAAVWNQHREITGNTLTREQLETLRYVRYHATSGGDAFVDTQLARAGIRTNVALSTLSFTLVPYMLPGTSLFAFVHERLIRASPLWRELKVIEPPIELSPISETMYWHPVFHNDPAHNWLRECLTTLAANL